MKLTGILALQVIVGTIASTSALDYNQSVVVGGPPTTVPGNDAGIYYGSGGNHNGGFTVDHAGQLELGLRAHSRYTGSDVGINSPDGVYAFTDSNPPVAPQPANRASWNYDFSIWTGTAPLSSYKFELALDMDPSANSNFKTINPVGIGDNAPAASLTIAQNSENYGFSNEGIGIPPYDQNVAGSYDIVLTARDSQDNIVARTAIRVDVNGGAASVPDGGATGMLLATTCVCLIGSRKIVAAQK